MLDDRELPSLHGRLIGCVIEHWGGESLFEQNDQAIRNRLSEALSSKLNFETQVTWDMSSALIDEGMVAGVVAYLNENGVASVMTFNVTATGTKAKEYEEN
jgi:hypothetical protein